MLKKLFKYFFCNHDSTTIYVLKYEYVFGDEFSYEYIEVCTKCDKVRFSHHGTFSNWQKLDWDNNEKE